MLKWKCKDFVNWKLSKTKPRNIFLISVIINHNLKSVELNFCQDLETRKAALIENNLVEQKSV